jgi:iron(III) transport system substrate-binding protein
MFTPSRRGLLAAALATLTPAQRARAAAVYQPPGDLAAAARKEGRLVLYTTAYNEVEQEVINLFNKTFPWLRVEMVRASGGQLITRIRSEAAAGKLNADLVDHSDPGLMREDEALYQSYTPPNAGDYRTDLITAGKMWPSILPPWTIVHNTEVVKNPPRTWLDLCKTEYSNGQIGMVIAGSGGSTWARIMFERMVLGEDYWARQAATKPKLFPSGAPLADAVVRGEVPIGVVVQNAAFGFRKDGAPVAISFPPEGVPVLFTAMAIPKTAPNPNAARVYADWKMSLEAQIDTIVTHGNLSALNQQPAVPEGFDPAKVKLWVPDFQKHAGLQRKWVEEWNQTYGYRQ